MHKKIIMACMATAAFAAFAAPSASAVNLKENGITVAAGASITAKNVGHVTFTGGNLTVTCTSLHMSGTVTADTNGTNAIEIPAGNPVFTGTGESNDCTSDLGSVKPTVNSKLCFHIPNGTDTVTVTGCGNNLTITLNVTTVVTCRYSAASITGTVTTAPKDAELLFLGQPFEEEGGLFLCPDTVSLDMEVVLSTTDGTTLQFTS